MPNDIEHMNNDIVKENNQNNNFRNTTPNITNNKKYSQDLSININLGNSSKPNNNAVAHYPNINDEKEGNSNNVNNPNDFNAPNSEQDIINVNINTLDETVSETLVSLIESVFI